MNRMKYEPEKFNVRLFDPKNDACYVDLETLTHVLQGIQKAILILVKDELRCPQDKTLPAKIKKAFSIRCTAPQSGSYVMPIEFGASDALLCESQDFENVKNVADKFISLLMAFNSGKADDFKRVVSSAYHKSLLTASRGMFPKVSNKWSLGISGKKISQEIQYSPQSAPKVFKRIQENVLPQDETSLRTVTGYLVKMDFESHCITLKYPPTSTELRCYYTDDLEVELFENRRELLQITGNVTYAKDRETPTRIVNVDCIQFLDLSEFIVESFCVNDNEFEFIEPLVLMPKLTDSCQFITLQDERLGIDVIAQTRDELEEELHADLRMLWEQSRMPDNKLGKVFQSQKKNLLAAIKENKYGDA